MYAHRCPLHRSLCLSCPGNCKRQDCSCHEAAAVVIILLRCQVLGLDGGPRMWHHCSNLKLHTQGPYIALHSSTFRCLQFPRSGDEAMCVPYTSNQHILQQHKAHHGVCTDRHHLLQHMFCIEPCNRQADEMLECHKSQGFCKVEVQPAWMRGCLVNMLHACTIWLQPSPIA